MAQGSVLPDNPRSMPRNPPTQIFMDMLRTRGRRSPLTVTVEWSAGHRQIPAALPQYGQSGLWAMSWLTSQLEGLEGSPKFIQPLTQTSGSWEEYGHRPLASSNFSFLS